MSKDRYLRKKKGVDKMKVDLLQSWRTVGIRPTAEHSDRHVWPYGHSSAAVSRVAVTPLSLLLVSPLYWHTVRFSTGIVTLQQWLRFEPVVNNLGVSNEAIRSGQLYRWPR